MHISRKTITIGMFVVVGIVATALLVNLDQRVHTSAMQTHAESQSASGKTATVVVAGGCFWCVESDLEKVPGVLSVLSGYSGGESEYPTYENYAEGGHREVVEVTYDPALVSLPGLLTYFIKHIDPTDPDGSFYDRGVQYSPAIYYANDEEQRIAEEVLESVDEVGVYEKPLAVPVLQRATFWPAEEYHQDYYIKNPIRYRYYRHGSGRDAFIKKHWGDEASVIPAASHEQSAGTENSKNTSSASWSSFTKPSDEVLRAELDQMQYKVTQKGGTEPPFQNEYHNLKDEGIYVDIVSGEPLFSSRDKFDSGTGWPSFTKPIDPSAVTTRDDRKLFVTRTEVRSRYAGSHLGHVLNDGPARTGLRYCMNSAALHFVPKERLEEEGYGELLRLFDQE